MKTNGVLLICLVLFSSCMKKPTKDEVTVAINEYLNTKDLRICPIDVPNESSRSSLEVNNRGGFAISFDVDNNIKDFSQAVLNALIQSQIATMEYDRGGARYIFYNPDWKKFISTYKEQSQFSTYPQLKTTLLACKVKYADTFNEQFDKAGEVLNFNANFIATSPFDKVAEMPFSSIVQIRRFDGKWKVTNISINTDVGGMKNNIEQSIKSKYVS
jgi:hypothetical protein